MYFPLHPICLIPMLVGLILVLVGFITKIFPPQKINLLYGYRTKSSMKNIERWKFAQEYSSNESIKMGIILALTCLVTLNFTNVDIFAGLLVGLGLVLLVVIFLFIRTEKAIKAKFGA